MAEGKPEVIQPLDLARCQAEVTITYNEPFRIGSQPVAIRERCFMKAMHILREVDGAGHMTVCDECLAVFKSTHARKLDRYTIEEIGK